MTFASSPQSFQTKDFPEGDVDKYLLAKSASKINQHFFHGIYLVNLASESKSLLKASIDSLIFYQQMAAKIAAVGTIFHIGSHKGKGFSETFSQIVSSINYVLDSSPKGIRLIMENCAGQAGTVGSKFEELYEIISRTGDKSKIGVCLDTQHMFASGYTLEKSLDRFDKIIGLKHLSAIHLNDSKTEFGSNVDRHENLGVGKIGKEALSLFLSDSRLKNIPIILEVPGEGNGPRKIDIDLARSMGI